LVRNAPGSAYEVPALVVVAREADKRFEASSSDQRQAALEQAWKVYERLSQRLGDDPQTLQASQNARVALSKAASYAEQLGRHAEAGTKLDRLLAAYPQDKNYLRRAGLSHYQSGRYAEALASWRALLSGLKDGTDAWYEAKYYQILCLQPTAPETAKKVLRQFRLLHPQLGSPDWQDRFRSLLNAT
jgi:tetratricopeptide (TPR) repeat protein